jgi:hypothetical protein
MSDQPVLTDQDRKRISKDPWIEGSGDDNEDEDSKKEIGSGEFGEQNNFGLSSNKLSRKKCYF